MEAQTLAADWYQSCTGHPQQLAPVTHIDEVAALSHLISAHRLHLNQGRSANSISKEFLTAHIVLINAG